MDFFFVNPRHKQIQLLQRLIDFMDLPKELLKTKSTYGLKSTLEQKKPNLLASVYLKRTMKLRESWRWYLGYRDPAMNNPEDERNLKQKRKLKLNTRRRKGE